MDNILYYLQDNVENTLLSTELNGLPNDALCLGNNTTIAASGYLLADIALTTKYNLTPTVNTAISLWMLRTLDGVNYEDGGSGVTPGRAPDIVFPLRNVTSPQRIIRQTVLPPGQFKPLIKNDGTGQSLAGSGNMLSLKAYTYTW